MKTLKFNNQEISDTFGNEICKNYEEALKLAISEYKWKEEDILERVEKVSFKLETGEIIDTTLNCIMVDPGSVDYIYYL